MIVKIEHIKNIGNYEDYQASGDVALKKMSLIYAENGAGKTTLSRILHSLSLNDGKVISNHYRSMKLKFLMRILSPTIYIQGFRLVLIIANIYISLL